MILFVFGIIVLVVICIAASQSKPKSAQLVVTPPEAIQAVMSRPIYPVIAGDVIAKKGETIYHVRRNVETIAEHHHSVYVGSGSVSMRVARGMYVHSGSTRRKITRTTVDVDDRGTLAVSNQRLVFLGQRATIDVPFSKIAGLTPFTDGFQLHRSNGKSVVFRTNSFEDYAITQRIMLGDLKNGAPS